MVSIPLNTEQIRMIHSVLQAHQLALLDVHEGSVEADTERPIGFRIDPEVETDERQSEDE